MAILSSAGSRSRGALGACFVALLAGACLDPLPSPTECEDPVGYVAGDECRACPPPPLVGGDRDCVSTIVAKQLPETCLTSDPSVLGCLLGEDPVAQCSSSPDPELPACYSSACPSALSDRIPGAVCLEEREGAQWVDFTTPPDVAERSPPFPCMCRSAEELARCDGRGVVVAAVNRGALGSDEGYRSDAFAIPIRVEAPSGQLGVYARARGYSSFLALGVQTETSSMTNVTSLGSADFRDFVLFGALSDGFTITDDGELATEPLSFGSESSPVHVVVGAAAEAGFDELFPDGAPDGVDNSSRRFYYVEIDCVIPFYVPD
jgi:hypothetical protein